MNRKILQIIPTDGNYYVKETKQMRKFSYRVVAWALVELGEINDVIPMIAGQRTLILMPAESDYTIERQQVVGQV